MLTSPVLLFLVVFASLASAALQLALPMFSLQVFNRILPSGDVSTLLFIAAGTAVMIAFQSAFDYLRSLMLVKFAGRLTSEVKLQIQTACPAGELQDSLADVACLEGVMESRAFKSLLEVPGSVALLAVLFYINSGLGLLTLAALAVLYSSSLLIGSPPRAAQASLEAAVAGTSQSLQRLHGARAYLRTGGLDGRLRQTLRRFKDESITAHVCLRRVQLRGDALREALRHLVQLAIMATAAYLVLSEQLDAGAIVASGLLFGKILMPHDTLSRSVGLFVSARRAWRRVDRLRLTEKASTLPTPLPILPSIRAVGITVRYDGREAAVLSDVDVCVNAGQLVVVTGPDGSGKTSLLLALAGELAVSAGKVLWDDLPVEQVNMSDHRRLGLLTEDDWLGDGTVYQAISTYRDVMDIDEVVLAARLADAHAGIMSLSRTYETRVHSTELSATLRARVRIARAFYGHPKVLCLDNPTRGLGPESEEALATTLVALKSRKIALVVTSQSPAIMARADLTIVLESGAIAARLSPAAVREAIQHARRPSYRADRS